MDCSMPGFPVHHPTSQSLLRLTSIESVMPFNHLILSRPLLLLLSSFPASGSFPVSQFFASGGQSIGVSVSAVFPMIAKDWFPCSPRNSQAFSNTTVQKHQSVFIPIPKKGNAKKCSNYHTIALITHVSKVMLKILQVRLQQYMSQEQQYMNQEPCSSWI